MPTDIYNDPDINTGDEGFPDSITLDAVGDGARGRILLIEKANTRYGPALKYTLFGRGRGPSNVALQGEDRRVTMLARPTNLKGQMLEMKPIEGDVIDVKLVELRDVAQGTAKLFDVEVERGDAQQLAPPPRAEQSRPDPGRASAPRPAEDEGGEDIFDR
jgi:hypothetical protein